MILRTTPIRGCCASLRGIDPHPASVISLPAGTFKDAGSEEYGESRLVFGARSDGTQDVLGLLRRPGPRLMDTTIFALVMPTLIALVGITNPQAGLIGSAYLVGSAVGGWGGGIVADRIGRVRTLQIMILFVAAFTFLSAFSSNFGELFVARFLQGFGYGGESAIGGVLISEVIRPQLRGRVAATVQSGYAAGYAASVIIYPILFALLPQALAWRAFLIVGFLPALFVFLIRRLVPESQIFVETNKVMEKERVAPSIATIFHKQYLRTHADLSDAVMWRAWRRLCHDHLASDVSETGDGMPVTQTAGFLIVNILGSLTGPIVYGLLSDRIGRRRSFVVFLLCPDSQRCDLYVRADRHVSHSRPQLLPGRVSGWAGVRSGSNPSPSFIRQNCVPTAPVLFGRGVGRRGPGVRDAGHGRNSVGRDDAADRDGDLRHCRLHRRNRRRTDAARQYRCGPA